jgi:hypothetical protein
LQIKISIGAINLRNTININILEGIKTYNTRKTLGCTQDGRVQVMARVERKVYKEFKKLCVDRDATMRDAIESLMVSCIAISKQKEEKC